jgi:hypothetical protein
MFDGQMTQLRIPLADEWTVIPNPHRQAYIRDVSWTFYKISMWYVTTRPVGRTHTCRKLK